MKRMICTPVEAAEALATRPAKVRELLDRGEIPAYKEGRNYKIPIVLLEDYIVERAQKETKERRENGE